MKALLRRASPQPAGDEVLRFGRLEIDLGARMARLDGQPCDLTSHQFDLLVVLAQSPGRVLSRDQIMDSLKGHPLEAFDRSIDVHISRIRAVIEDDPKAPRRVLTVRGAGYVFAKKQDSDADGRAAPTPRPAMKSLYVRIYVTVVAVLLLFAAVSGWVLQRHLDEERARVESVLSERMQAWAELIQRSMPGPDAPRAEQAEALRDWSQRLRVPLALDDPQGQRVAASESFLRRQADGGGRALAVRLEDERTLWVMRPGGLRASQGAGRGAGGPPRAGPGPGESPPLPFVPPTWPRGVGLAILLAVLFIAVAAGAYPVVRRLTRRLEALKQGVERFGAGAARAPRRGQRQRRSGGRGGELQRAAARSRRWCARTSRCSQTRATNCARRWHA